MVTNKNLSQDSCIHGHGVYLFILGHFIKYKQTLQAIHLNQNKNGVKPI